MNKMIKFEWNKWMKWQKDEKLIRLIKRKKDGWNVEWKMNERWNEKMNVNHENLDGMINEKMNGMLNNLITR